MFVEGGTTQGESVSQERRDRAQPDSRVLGHVVQCDGARATIAAIAVDVEGAAGSMWSVGRMGCWR